VHNGNKSAQAVLRFKIARLERLLTELNQHEREMRAAMSAIAALEQQERNYCHDDS
jgi:hypothetical protein